MMVNREILKVHWLEQLEYANRLRDNALKALSELAIEETLNSPFREYINKLLKENGDE